MKTKLSKKLLSAFLAVMMIVTSIPLMGISAFAAEVEAADDANVTAAKAAMEAFENSINKPGEILTNVLPAYQAYVDVQEAIDAYQYGSLSAGVLKNYRETLESLTANVTVFVPYTAANTGSYSDETEDRTKWLNGQSGYDYVSDASYNNNYNSLLYAETNTSDVKGSCNYQNEKNSQGNLIGVETQLKYPKVTMLYDGVEGHTPKTTVGLYVIGGPTSQNKDRYVYTTTMTSNIPGLALGTNWKGTDSRFNVQWMLTQGDKMGKDTTNNALNLQVMVKATLPGRRKQNSYYLANTIEYKGNGTNSQGNSVPVITATDYSYTTYSGSATTVSHNDNTNVINVGSSASPAIVIINYKYLQDYLSQAGEGMKNKDLTQYSEGGLLEYFQAMEAATKWNPNDYFNGGVKTNGNANNYTACGEDMAALAGDLRAVISYAGDTNSENFKLLRDAMSTRKSDYNNGIKPDRFEQESYNGFVTLWKQGMSVMNSLTSVGYDETKMLDADGNQIDLAQLANLIKTYNIKTNVYLTDVTGLTAVIDGFEAYVNMFTAETYQPVLDIVADAKATVWPTADGKGDYKSTQVQLTVQNPNDSTEPNQVIVNNFTAQIQAAIVNLRIDPNAVIMTGKGRYSLNSACDLINHLPNGHAKEDFTNYGQFESAVNAATEDGGYRSKLPSTPMMNYTTQYNEYKSEIEKIVQAYDDLALSFILIDDGSIARDPSGTQKSLTTSGMANAQRRSAQVGFEISDNQAQIIKTTHDKATIPYGDAYITYGTTVDGSSRSNYLDSFTMNATANTNREISSAYNDNGKALAERDCKFIEGDEESGQYAGLLSYQNVTLNQFEVYERNYSNVLSYYGKALDGTILDQLNYLPEHDYYTEILATTEGKAEKQPGGAIYALSNNSDSFGTVTLKGVANVEVDATTPLASDLNATLTREQILATYPNTGTIVGEPTRITASGNYGATVKWNFDVNGWSQVYASYAFINSKDNSDETQRTYETGATIVDLADYFDFIRFCDRFSALGGEKWDQELWGNFQNALTNAKTYAWKTKTAEQIRLALNPKYSALYTALEALTPRTYTVNFVTKDATGADVNNNIVLNYGETLAMYTDQINAIDTATTYKKDYCTWTYNGTYTLDPEWQHPVDIDLNATVASHATYYAVYESTPNLADFSAFNTAKRTILSLADFTYTVVALEDLASKVATMTYFTYSPEQQAETSEQYQNAIDAETRMMNAWISQLKAVSLSGEAYDAAATASQMQINAAGDIDQYDLVPDFTYFEEIEIGNEAVIKGVTFTTEAEMNAAVTAFLNDLNSHVRNYNIYVNGAKITEAPIAYGTTVVVNSDNTISIVQPNEITTNKEGVAQVNWSYSYDAPSRNNAGASQSKYMTTSTSFGFIVKGDAYLTTTPATQDETNYLVTVKASTGNIIDVCSTTGEYTMPSTLPAYAYYTVDSVAPFSNGAQLGETITVTEDTTIVVNYVPTASELLTITTAETFDDVLAGTAVTEQYAYNTKISLSNPDAYCWVLGDVDFMEGLSSYYVLYYGTDYSFYAASSYVLNYPEAETPVGKAVFPLTYDEYYSLVADSTSYEKILGTSDYETSFNEDATDVIRDGQGNPLYAASVTVNKNKPTFTIVDPISVSTITAPVSVTKNSDGVSTKFSLVATFTLPEGYSMVESGYLFTKNIDLAAGMLTIENCGSNSDIIRMKSSKYTVGNQFVVNYNTTKTFDFKYVAYSIIKNDTTGEVNTYYSAVSNDFNNAAL